MNLAQYQRIASFYHQESDEIVQIALIVCDMWGLSYDEVDNMQPKKFIKYSNKVTKEFKKLNKKPLIGRVKLQTDAYAITFGQFIEVQHFMKQGEIDAMHLISSSIWQDKRDHATKAKILLDINVRYVLKDFTLFLISFSNLIKSYKGLFEVEQV